MSEKPIDISSVSTREIRIQRLNTDKTRKDIVSDTVYHVCFELSGPPPSEWRTLFGQEWRRLDPTHEAEIDGAFLVLHCPLHDVAATKLQALKKAVAATNEAYQRFAQEQASALEIREDVWKQERMDVDALATSLRFE